MGRRTPRIFRTMATAALAVLHLGAASAQDAAVDAAPERAKTAIGSVQSPGAGTEGKPSELLLAPEAELIEVPSRFMPHHWTEGLHLMAGIGLNSSIFANESYKENLGLGTSLRADVMYVVKDGFALEVGANVMFNRVRDLLIWDTLLTIGVRARLPSIRVRDDMAPFTRIFVGKGKSVSFFEGTPPEPYAQLGAQRLHLEGFVIGAGLGIGQFRMSQGGRVWFLELTGVVHSYKELKAVASQDDVPIVITANPITDRSAMYSLTLSLGVLAF